MEEGYLNIHRISSARGVCTFFILPDEVDAGDMDYTYHAGPDFRSWFLMIATVYRDNSKNSGEWIVDYINQVYPQVKQVDYALITHFHSDHKRVLQSDSKTALKGGTNLRALHRLAI